MNYKIFDAHCDTLCLLNDNDASIISNGFHIDKTRMEKYKKYTQIFACFIDPIYKGSAMERFMELSDTFYSQNIDGILSVENAEMVTSLKVLRTLQRLGVRAASLTWNYSNHLAAGVLEPDKSKGLTDFGKEVVKEMDRIGMILDVSHLNDKSFWDIIELVGNKTIIASHSNARAVCSDPRNLTDDQICQIAVSGGCIGLNLYPPFIKDSGKANYDDIIAHIWHIVNIAGEDCIGIGADFDGVDGNLPDGINGCEDLYKLFDKLLQLNHSEEFIEKLSYKNFERVFGGEKKCPSFLQREKIFQKVKSL